MTRTSDIKKPEKLYRGQELTLYAIPFPEETLKPRAVWGKGKTITGKHVGEAVFATDSFEYASLYTIPKVDEFTPGFIGYNINQRILIISHFAKTCYEKFPHEFGYVYTIENTKAFTPVLIGNHVAEWYAKEEITPSAAVKINGLDDIIKHSQVLYLSPFTSWRDWAIFRFKNHGNINEIHNALQEGILISYNKEKNVNCIDFKIQEEPKNKKDSLFKRLLAEKLLGKYRQ